MNERQFNVWLDSGANSESTRSTIVSLKEIGFTNKQWDNLTDLEKDDIMREVAYESAEWGYNEL
jgi:hypothetical protein